jgi:hypothetical protein
MLVIPTWILWDYKLYQQSFHQFTWFVVSFFVGFANKWVMLNKYDVSAQASTP